MAALFTFAVAALAGLSPAAVAAPSETGRPSLIRQIRTEGAVQSASVRQITDIYIGKPADPAQVEALLKQLSATSRSSGLAFYSWTMTGWDADAGVLRIALVPGFIERIDLPDGAAMAPLRRILTPLLEERPLRRSTYEDGSGWRRACQGCRSR